MLEWLRDRDSNHGRAKHSNGLDWLRRGSGAGFGGTNVRGTAKYGMGDGRPENEKSSHTAFLFGWREDIGEPFLRHCINTERKPSVHST